MQQCSGRTIETNDLLIPMVVIVLCRNENNAVIDSDTNQDSVADAIHRFVVLAVDL